MGSNFKRDPENEAPNGSIVCLLEVFPCPVLRNDASVYIRGQVNSVFAVVHSGCSVWN